tara:strand:- start:112 stop:516 length:405 start_codon:yes stop_codon:yes gene_type:complete
MENCIFCKIVNGEIPCNKVYEDSDNLAFLDINPSSMGHTMVISRTHSATILELEDDKLQSLIIAVKKITKKIEERLQPAGFSFGINHGKVSGQSVPHLHIHIFPRYENDQGGSVHSIVKHPGNKSVEEIYELLK